MAKIEDGLYRPQIVIPKGDFGMYEEMNRAFEALHECLDNLMRNHGRIGHAAQNLMSDLSKAHIEAVQRGDEEEVAWLERSMEELMNRFSKAEADGEIAESGNQFGRSMWQECHEAELFHKIWPAIERGEKVQPLMPWDNFKGNVQAFLFAYLDVVSELAKALNKKVLETLKEGRSEFYLFDNYLPVAESILLRLSQERHIPGYVINNGRDRWATYSKKLRTAYGCVANVRQDYSLRLSVAVHCGPQK